MLHKGDPAAFLATGTNPKGEFLGRAMEERKDV
jgi:hypothetical protein